MMKRMVRITYQDGIAVDEDNENLTLLEISLKHGISHVHACGGHARCSTCRVMIHDGLANALPRNEAEQHLASLKGLEPNVRLACQTHVVGPVRIRRLVLDDKDIQIAVAEHGDSSGREEHLAILFSDILPVVSLPAVQGTKPRAWGSQSGPHFRTIPQGGNQGLPGSRTTHCPFALFSDPGRTEHARPLRRVGVAPAMTKTKAPTN
jgi:ferredoxin